MRDLFQLHQHTVVVLGVEEHHLHGSPINISGHTWSQPHNNTAAKPSPEHPNRLQTAIEARLLYLFFCLPRLCYTQPA